MKTHPRRKHGRTRTIVVLSFAVLFSLAAGAAWLKRSSAAEALPYRTATVARGALMQTISASGTLEPVNTVEVGSQVSGNISAIHADFNDAVTAGMLLAEIDPSTYEAHVLQAAAQLESAQAALDLARLESDRAAQLLERSLVSRSDYDSTVVQLKQQTAAVRIRQAELDNAHTNLARTKIYAPIDGTILSRNVSVGQTVQASFSAPTLFEIAQDLREMEIAASVSEADIGHVVAGQSVAFTVDAFPGRTFSGRVRQVRNNPTLSQNVVNYTTIITVANDDSKLRPGMTADVTITTAARSDVLLVPNSSLRFQPAAGTVVAEASTTAAPTTSRDGPPVGMGPSPEGSGTPSTRPNGSGLGAGSRRRAAGPESAVRATQKIHVLLPAAAGDASGSTWSLAARTVVVGVTDGASTEIVNGLQEGDVVVTGNALPAVAGVVAADTVNPFAPRPPTRR
jgi:HlyD family secretion protein